MTALALNRAIQPSTILAELRRRQPLLTRFGLTLLACAGGSILLEAVDSRTLASGVGLWVKPTKFFASISLFALTTAWFYGYVRPERRTTRAMRGIAAVIVGAGSFELAYICWQAAQGLESHFYVETPVYAAMYALMGMGAMLIVGTTLPLAWEIGRRPEPGLERSFIAAVVAGLVLTFFLGGGLGAYMSSTSSHAVGPEGEGLPIFGWNRLGGDLRVAHFFGIHAQQALPLLAAGVARARERTRWLAVGGGTVAYAALTLGVFVRALGGKPFLAAG